MSLKLKLTAALAAAAIGAAAIGSVSALPMTSSMAGSGASSDGPIVNAQTRKGFYKQNGQQFYNGHRGYRKPRPGYKQYNGWRFPLAAFAAGAVIRGSMNQGRAAPTPSGPAGGGRSTRLSPEHYSWCTRKYKSYRASDNTYQPYHGPRQQCRSPFWFKSDYERGRRCRSSGLSAFRNLKI